MDQLEQLKQVNETLAVDSVVLDKIIKVIDAWDKDVRRYPDLRMIEIAKIIKEWGEYTGTIEDEAFMRAFTPEE